MNEFEFECGAFFGPGLFFETSDVVGEFGALGFEGNLFVERAGGVKGNGEYSADEILIDLGEVEAVDGSGKAVGREPVGFVEFVV